MFVNFKSKNLPNYLNSFLFIIFLNSLQNFGVNANSISYEFNKTVTSSSDTWTSPKLLGIFADGVNDSIIENNDTLSSNFDFNNQVQNESKITRIRKIIPVQEIVKNLIPVPQSESNSSETSAQDVTLSLYSNVGSTEANEVLPLNPCKKLNFHKTSNDENESQVSAHCVLGPIPQSLDGVPFAASATMKEPDVYYYNIPDEDNNEVIRNTSYIAIMVEVCSEPKGRVLIIDEMSNQQLLSFNNLGTTRICNHWDNEFESFVSDSNKVRIEVDIPIDESAIGGPDKDFAYLSDSVMNGKRRIENKYFLLNLVYFEIKFNNNESEELEPDDKEREVIYQPNSVFTYKLMPPSKNEKNEIKVGVKIELKFLDIDEDAGDFVLIGPGYEPTHRELSNAQIISKNIGEEEPPRDIFVNADSAYIRLVTHNSFKQGTALKFSWNAPNDTLYDVDEEKVSDRIKNSAIKICVLDNMCTLFQNALEDHFKEEMVHITNDFLFKKNDDNEEDETKKLVSKKSVLIFDKEDGVYDQQGDKNKIYCQMNMAITSAFNEQWPLVSHTTLHYIFFGDKYYRDMHSTGYLKVTDCSHDGISLLKMILPIIIILIVSIVLLFIAWRYQYRNWTHLQRTENAKYVNPPIDDPNEDQLYAKDNPIFVEDESHFHSNKERTSQTTRSIDSVDGRPAEHKQLSKQLSHGSSTSSSRKLPPLKESPEFVKNLWLSPGTSRQQNEYVFDDISSDDKSDDNWSTSHTTRDNNMSKANTYSKSSGDTLTAQLPITGLNGTQHESLRQYPRSALRRPTIVSENEIPITIDGNPVRRGSKVQFELPIKSNKIQKNTLIVEPSIE